MFQEQAPQGGEEEITPERAAESLVRQDPDFAAELYSALGALLDDDDGEDDEDDGTVDDADEGGDDEPPVMPAGRSGERVQTRGRIVMQGGR